MRGEVSKMGDDIYIVSFTLVSQSSTDEIINALKKAGCCTQHP